jgi:formamidopyrimidine-DNA glycosylase
MPELPEVETVVRDLRPLLVGRRIVAVRHSAKALRQPWRAQWSSTVRGQVIQAVERRGKWILLEFQGGRCLVLHLGMTGQLQVWPATAAERDHVHLVLALDDRRELRFRDIRRFGGVTLFSDLAARQAFFEDSGLGSEPFDLDASAWRARLAATTRCVKAVLLDQRMVAGVGNIYADESLFEARMNPGRHADSLTRQEADRLRRAIGTVLDRAINKRGSSIRDYIGGSGLKGGYQKEFRVYGRTGDPCGRCKQPIARIRLAGRSTHYCPQCQK